MKVSVNQDEMNAIQEKADLAGLSRSRFVREVVLGYKVKARDTTMTPELIRLNSNLGKIGGNLNQVARSAYKNGVTQDWIIQASKTVEEVSKIIEEVSDLIIDR